MDLFAFKCDCGTELRSNYDRIGFPGRCPNCQRTFTIPFPAEMTTKRLSCRCGLVMEYSVLDAGMACQCPNCKVLFRIPGGKAESIERELNRESRIQEESKRAVVRAIYESVPLSPMLEDLERPQERRLRIEEKHSDKWIIPKILISIVISIVILTVAGYLVLVPTNLWKVIASNYSIPTSSDAPVPDPEPTNIDPSEARSQKAEVPVVQPTSQQLSFVRIGAKPSSVSPEYPKGIEFYFPERELTQIEAKGLVQQVAKAVGSNSSKALCDLMDAEVLGNHLFSHTNLTPKVQFLHASEAMAMLRNNPTLSPHRISAQAFGVIEVKGDWIGLLRVSNNYRIGNSSSPAGPSGELVANTRSQEMINIVREFDTWRAKLDRRLPAEFQRYPAGANEVPRATVVFQQTPFQRMFDNNLMYFAVIGTRSRSGKTVVRDFACLNYRACLLESMWDIIDADTEPKAMVATRPVEDQWEKYSKLLVPVVGDKTVSNLMVANYAMGQLPMAGPQMPWLKPLAGQNLVGIPSPNEQLTALQELESTFPDDHALVMMQALIAKKAGKVEQADEALARAAKLGVNNISFYEELMEPYRTSNDPVRAKAVLDAVKQNCK